MNKAELAVFEIQKQMYNDKEFFGKSAKNPFYNSKYVPLNDILQIIVPKLHEKDCKLKHTMEPTAHPGYALVTCTVTHIDGSTDSSSVVMPLEVHEVTKHGEAVVKLNGQESGKAYTYGRRYSAVPLFGIPEHDDDCEGAMKREPSKPAKKPGCITPEQAAELRRIFADIAPDHKKFGEWMEFKYNAKRFDDVKESRYQELLKDMISFKNI